jgi:hypothetical protein
MVMAFPIQIFKVHTSLHMAVDYVSSLSNSLRESRKDDIYLVLVYIQLSINSKEYDGIRLCGSINRGRLHR